MKNLFAVYRLEYFEEFKREVLEGLKKLLVEFSKQFTQKAPPMGEAGIFKASQAWNRQSDIEETIKSDRSASKRI